MGKRKILYTFTSQIPKGKVATYGQLAKLSGIKSPRVVGNLLHKNLDPNDVPCHRVVNSRGEVATNYAFGGAKSQLDKLKEEGVVFSSEKVDLSKSLWKYD